jgi:large subunit ribosomal protein L29
MKAKDMREKSAEDLRELEKSLVRDAFQAKLKNFTNRLDDTSQIGKARRDLARVKTLLAELARKAGQPVGAAKATPAKVAPPAAAKAPKKDAAKASAKTAKAPSKKAPKAPSEASK